MSYIEELRELVGNRPLIMVGAALLITDQEGRLLLLRRADNGCWGIPGGAMEPGESLESTARRETFEETGLIIDTLSLFGVFSGPELYYHYPNGAEVYNVTVAYTAKVEACEIRLDPAEHTEWAYFEMDKLPGELSPPIQPILAHYSPPPN